MKDLRNLNYYLSVEVSCKYTLDLLVESNYSTRFPIETPIKVNHSLTVYLN